MLKFEAATSTADKMEKINTMAKESLEVSGELKSLVKNSSSNVYKRTNSEKDKKIPFVAYICPFVRKTLPRILN